MIRISLFITGLLTVGIISCNRSTTGSGNAEQKISATSKPSVDTAKVLNTLELYRARRYEDIQEGVKSGADQVYKLVLYGRDMEVLTPEIARLTYLASLDISHNQLSELPDAISALHYLQGFYATDNRLTKFPDQVLLLPVLARIDLSGNQISAIPPEISVMKQLTRLTMDRNQLTSLPVEVYELTNLSVLELAENGLPAIPVGISNLRSLSKLDLSNNQLTRLPKEITVLAGTLAELNVQGNQLPREDIAWLMEAMPETQIRF